MSASMAGVDIATLVLDNLDTPDALAIDFHSNNRIYWCDHKQSLIESINHDGSDRVKLYHVGLSSPFRVDVFESHIYWVSLQSAGSLTKLDKFGRGSFIKLVAELDLVQDLKIFHPQKVPSNGKLCFAIIKFCVI